MKTATLHESMTTETRPIWVVRAAKHGEAHSLFLTHGLVALEDQGLGNLSKLKADRQAFYAVYRRLQPNDSRVSTAGIAGKFFRFAHEMAKGDMMLYPATKEACVYVGTIVGSYRYNPKLNEKFPHQLSVDWVGTMGASALSQPARHELGAARMLFQFKRHEEGLRQLLDNRHLKRLLTF